MTIHARLIAATATIVILASCMPVQQPVQVSTPSAQPDQTAQQPETLNQEVLKVLLDLAGVREEIKRLRNSIEEIQFETENAKRRQQDLFENIEQRMVSIEKNQQVLNSQSGSPQVDVNVQGSEEGSGDGSEDGSGDGSGLASRVVVGDGNNANTSVSQITTAPNKLPANNPSTPAPSEQSAVPAQEQQVYDQAFKLLTQSRYEDAIIQFQQMVDTWPHSQLADDAYYWMSEARYVNREFEHALGGFKTLVSKYPESKRVPEALLKIGYIQHDIGDYEKAANTFRDILVRFPGHQVTVSAQTRLRRIEQTIQ